MSRINNTLYAILGILAQGPRSGYDIRKRFDESLRFFWSESYGQIYPMLKHAVSQGYAEQIASGGPRNKKLYRITAEGEAEFRRWLAVPVNPISYRDELLLRIYLAGSEDADAIASLLSKERDGLESGLAVLRAQEEQAERLYRGRAAPPWMMTLRYGILSGEARLRWCEESLRSLETNRENEV